MLRDPDGSLRGAKRGLGFVLRRVAAGGSTTSDTTDALEARFGASPPRLFRPLAPPEATPIDAGANAHRLDDYAGRYRSDELGEEMVVEASPDGRGLAVRLASPRSRHGRDRPRAAAARARAAAAAGCPTVTNVSALFRRDASGRVTTLVHQTSRAGAIAFERSAG